MWLLVIICLWLLIRWLRISLLRSCCGCRRCSVVVTVNLHVLLKTVFPRESLVADLTLIRLLSCMGNLVILQVVLAGEGFSTLVTFVGALPRVH